MDTTHPNEDDVPSVLLHQNKDIHLDLLVDISCISLYLLNQFAS